MRRIIRTGRLVPTALCAACLLSAPSSAAVIAYEYASVPAVALFAGMMERYANAAHGKLDAINEAMVAADANATRLLRNTTLIYELSARNTLLLKQIMENERGAADVAGLEIDTRTRTR